MIRLFWFLDKFLCFSQEALHVGGFYKSIKVSTLVEIVVFTLQLIRFYAVGLAHYNILDYLPTYSF